MFLLTTQSFAALTDCNNIKDDNKKAECRRVCGVSTENVPNFECQKIIITNIYTDCKFISKNKYKLPTPNCGGFSVGAKKPNLIDAKITCSGSRYAPTLTFKSLCFSYDDKEPSALECRDGAGLDSYDKIAPNEFGYREVSDVKK